jgi:hypothetical protein
MGCVLLVFKAVKQEMKKEGGGGGGKNTQLCVYTEGAIPRPGRVAHWSWVFIPINFTHVKKKIKCQTAKKKDATQTP